jgi:hypothetical protein
MKRLIGILALLALTALPAVAFAPSGIDGRVVDGSGQPVPGTTVAIFRLPLHQVDRAVATVKTDNNGYFVHLALDPGRYMVMATNGTYANDCAIHDVFNDNVTRVRMRLHPGTECRGARMHTALVNGNLTADLYVVH